MSLLQVLKKKKKFEVAEVETGYRLVDVKSFSSVLSTLHKCEEGEKNITHHKYALQPLEPKEKR